MERIFSFDQEEREYRAEIIEIIRGVGTDEEIKLALEEYHDNDIAAALEELSAEEREKLLAILGVEGMSEVIPFLEDAGEYLSELDASQAADKELGMEIEWKGSGVDEKGIDKATGKTLIEIDPKYFRPCEVDQLLGDPTKAKTLLGWNPCKTPFPELVRIMVEHDMKFVKKLHLKAQM